MGSTMTRLPETLRRYFWDVDPGALSVDGHRDWIIGRLLRSGGSDAVRWLRREVGDRELELWLRARDGGGLSSRRLRFWGLVLELPEELVERWVEASRRGPWGSRRSR